MSWRHDDESSNEDLIRDISDKHCPDSIRKTAYEELQRRGIDRGEAQRQADQKHGDFYG